MVSWWNPSASRLPYLMVVDDHSHGQPFTRGHNQKQQPNHQPRKRQQPPSVRSQHVTAENWESKRWMPWFVGGCLFLIGELVDIAQQAQAVGYNFRPHISETTVNHSTLGNGLDVGFWLWPMKTICSI